MGNPCSVFGLATTSPPKSQFNFLSWLVGEFHEYPDLPADKARLGKGYFVYSPNASLSVYATSSVVDTESVKSDPFVIDLYLGWNLIGDPYHGTLSAHTVRWYGNAVSVLVGDTEYSVHDAIAARIIKAGLWSYIGGRYELSYDIEEWKGYWVKAFQNCKLLIRRSETRSAQASSRSPLPGAANVWSAAVLARAGASASDSVSLGVSSDATDGYDIFSDIEKPPAVTAAPYVYLSFPHSEWSANAGSYGVDIRSPGGRKGWRFAVASNVRDSDVVLTWPGLERLPRDVNLTLVDEETGVRRFMRTSSGYQFRMGSGEAMRRFRVESAPAGQGVLRVSGLAVSGGRSGSRTVSCSISRDASVDVIIKSATASRIVRRVATSVTRAAGLAQFAWDCRDDGGAPVPAGPYVCEVRATGDDGQVAKGVTVLMVAR